MQDRYVGDIGDFGKYGMLRWLSGIPGDSMVDALKLGIVWYLNEPTNKESKSDGSKTEYLKCTDNNHQRFRVCDKDLYLALKDLVDSDNRRVTAVKEKGILGGAEFYSRLLPAPTDKQYKGKDPEKQRQGALKYKRHREEWFNAAVAEMETVDVVFLDPDNGIRADDSSPKHISIAELNRFIKGRKSLIFYYHSARHATTEIQLESIARSLKDNLGLSSTPWVLRWHPVQRRSYFIVPATPKHKEILRAKLETFLNEDKSQWAKLNHYTEVKV